MSMFGSVAKSAGHILKGLQIGPAMAQSLAAVPLTDQRQAFIAIMIATASHAGAKPNFNLELEINDLWTRLNNLKAESQASDAGTGLAPLMKSLGAFQQINAHLGQAVNALVRNTSSR